jgi:hypothetical protein
MTDKIKVERIEPFEGPQDDLSAWLMLNGIAPRVKVTKEQFLNMYHASRAQCFSFSKVSNPEKWEDDLKSPGNER